MFRPDDSPACDEEGCDANAFLATSAGEDGGPSHPPSASSPLGLRRGLLSSTALLLVGIAAAVLLLSSGGAAARGSQHPSAAREGAAVRLMDTGMWATVPDITIDHVNGDHVKQNAENQAIWDKQVDVWKAQFPRIADVIDKIFGDWDVVQYDHKETRTTATMLEVANLQRMFKEYDGDGDGALTPEEMRPFAEELKIVYSDLGTTTIDGVWMTQDKEAGTQLVCAEQGGKEMWDDCTDEPCDAKPNDNKPGPSWSVLSRAARRCGTTARTSPATLSRMTTSSMSAS